MRSRRLTSGLSRTLAASLGSLALTLLTCGCGSFDRDWRQAAATSVRGLEGAWEGTWTSHANAHTGRLRAIVRRNPDGNHDTRFHATFWQWFSAGYSVTLNTTPYQDGWRLEGRDHLGRWLFWEFGDYTYTGTATRDRFRCEYRGGGDHGVFEMQRPRVSTARVP